MRNVPANAAYLGSFEVMKRELAKARGCSVPELPLGTVAAAGGFGGLLYWVGVFPIDVIKSAMMTDTIVKGERQFPTMMSTAKVLTAHLSSCPA
jgi:solute carrier family 25 carnitine/acylcarnitine transporter 20/29